MAKMIYHHDNFGLSGNVYSKGESLIANRDALRRSILNIYIFFATRQVNTVCSKDISVYISVYSKDNF